MKNILKNYLFNLEAKAEKKNRDNILRLLPDFHGNVSILDLGCNDGIWTTELGKKYDFPILSGVEVVSDAAKEAIKKGISIKNFDLNGPFDYKSNMFDIVHSNQVIEHLHDTDSFLSEAYRILKPGGSFIVSTVSLSSWHNIFSLIMGFQPFDLANISVKGNIGNPLSFWSGTSSDKSILKSWQHLRVFTPYALTDFLKKYGFKDIKILSSGYYPLPSFLPNLDVHHSHYFVVRGTKKENE